MKKILSPEYNTVGSNDESKTKGHAYSESMGVVVCLAWCANKTNVDVLLSESIGFVESKELHGWG
jgi:hypothetical protein